jgi:hypothetical protein
MLENLLLRIPRTKTVLYMTLQISMGGENHQILLTCYILLRGYATNGWPMRGRLDLPITVKSASSGSYLLALGLRILVHKLACIMHWAINAAFGRVSDEVETWHRACHVQCFAHLLQQGGLGSAQAHLGYARFPQKLFCCLLGDDSPECAVEFAARRRIACKLPDRVGC